MYRISATLQRGTAEIVYGVTQGEKAPMSAARMAKDQQMVEAVLRDKDPEWYQAQNGGYSESTRTTRRVRSGKEAVIARRARTTRDDSGRQDDKHKSDRRGNSTLAPPARGGKYKRVLVIVFSCLCQVNF